MISNSIAWPNGARCACSITFDMDAESVLHLTYGQKAPTMIGTSSMLRYGPEIAIPRILNSYRRLGLRQTFFVPGWCVEQYPRAIEAIVADGHEIGHHGYLHELAYDRDRREERYWLKRGKTAIKALTGQNPRGWRAPLYSFSEHSADLLVEEEFLYDASLMGDDLPYILQARSGRIIELPSHWGLDDFPQYAHIPDLDFAGPIKAPEEAVRNYWNEFEAAYAHGGLWVAVWHPFLTGRLSRWHYIEKMIREMKERGDVWFAPLEEIAKYVQSLDPKTLRVDDVPYYDAPITLSREEKDGRNSVGDN